MLTSIQQQSSQPLLQSSEIDNKTISVTKKPAPKRQNRKFLAYSYSLKDFTKTTRNPQKQQSGDTPRQQKSHATRRSSASTTKASSYHGGPFTFNYFVKVASPYQAVVTPTTLLHNGGGHIKKRSLG